MDDTFTEEEFQDALSKILQNLMHGKTPCRKPSCSLVVGQPGAGKTTIADILSRQAGGNIILVSGDDYRWYHPRFRQLQAVHGDKAVLHTQTFAGKMTEAVIDSLSRLGYCLMIEGTLRTKEVPSRTRELLSSRGYRVTLDAMLVHPEESYLSTIKRFRIMEELGTVPRMTPKEHHDMVCRVFPGNLSGLYLSRKFENIRIFDRQECIRYDMGKEPKRNPGEVVAKEWSRLLTRMELRNLFDAYSQYVPRKTIQDVISSYGAWRGRTQDCKRGYGNEDKVHL